MNSSTFTRDMLHCVFLKIYFLIFLLLKKENHLSAQTSLLPFEQEKSSCILINGGFKSKKEKKRMIPKR